MKFMNTIKVRVKREQILEAFAVPKDGADGAIVVLPDSITLEIPADQIDTHKGFKTIEWLPPDTSKCEHCFQEFLLEGIGPVRHCARCGLAAEIERITAVSPTQQGITKRKRYQVHLHERVGGPLNTPLGSGDIIELEEVE